MKSTSIDAASSDTQILVAQSALLATPGTTVPGIQSRASDCLATFCAPFFRTSSLNRLHHSAVPAIESQVGRKSLRAIGCSSMLRKRHAQSANMANERTADIHSPVASRSDHHIVEVDPGFLLVRIDSAVDTFPIEAFSPRRGRTRPLSTIVSRTIGIRVLSRRTACTTWPMYLRLSRSFLTVPVPTFVTASEISARLSDQASNGCFVHAPVEFGDTPRNRDEKRNRT